MREIERRNGERHRDQSKKEEIDNKITKRDKRMKKTQKINKKQQWKKQVKWERQKKIEERGNKGRIKINKENKYIKIIKEYKYKQGKNQKSESE